MPELPKPENTEVQTAQAVDPAAICSALAGTFDIEAIEQAFFNHDHDGSESAAGQWEKRRDQWRSFKAYLAAHPRQKTSGRDAYKDEMPNAVLRSQVENANVTLQQVKLSAEAAARRRFASEFVAVAAEDIRAGELVYRRRGAPVAVKEES